MINLGKHHLQRIDAIAAATKETDVDVLARLLMELGPVLSAGQVTDWLWQESVRVGIERRSDHRDEPEAVEAWQGIEDGTAPEEPLTVRHVEAIVECGKPRRSSVKLDWGTP
jgi:hypothetical protein